MPTKKQERLLEAYGAESGKQFPAMIRLNPITGEGKGYMATMYQDVANLKDPAAMLQSAYRSHSLADGYRASLGHVTGAQAKLLEKNALAYTDENGAMTVSARATLIPKGDSVGIDFGSVRPNEYVARQLDGDMSKLADRFTQTIEVSKQISSLRKPIYEQVEAERSAAAKVAETRKAAEPKATDVAPKVTDAERTAKRIEQNAKVNERRANVAAEYTGDDAQRASLICTLYPKKGAEGSYYLHTYFNSVLSDKTGDLSGRGAVVDQDYVDAMAAKVPVDFEESGRGVFVTKATLEKADAVAPFESGRDVYIPSVESAQKEGRITRLINDGTYNDLFEVADASRDKVLNARADERAKAEAKAVAPEVAEPAAAPEAVEVSEPAIETENDVEYM